MFELEIATTDPSKKTRAAIDDRNRLRGPPSRKAG